MQVGLSDGVSATTSQTREYAFAATELVMPGARPIEVSAAFMLAHLVRAPLERSRCFMLEDVHSEGVRLGAWMLLVERRPLTRKPLFKPYRGDKLELSSQVHPLRRTTERCTTTGDSEMTAFAIGKLARYATRRSTDGMVISLDDGRYTEFRIWMRRRGPKSWFSYCLVHYLRTAAFSLDYRRPRKRPAVTS